MQPHRLQALGSGLSASLSIMAGYLPIAFSFGLAATQAGLSPLTAIFISVLVYAGASQFLLIGLLTSGAGLLSALPTVMLMNARHMLYGPALATELPSDPTSRLASPWLSFGLTDEVFATAMSKINTIDPTQREYWFVGLQAGAYGSWIVGTIIGAMLVGDVSQWPAAVREGLSFVLPALFFALLLEGGLARWKIAILAAAGTAALLSLFLPAYHALAAAIVAGALAHALLEKYATKEVQP